MPELFNVVAPQEALRQLQGHLVPLVGTEDVQVAEALGRVTSQDIHAPSSLPAFPRSTMDGYVVRAADTYGASEGVPAYLKMVGEIPMGRPAGLVIGPGEVAKVHTGGVVAEGADAVVMVENTQVVDASTIEVMRPVAPGENLLRVGDDVRAGALLIGAGRWLRPQDLGGLMALGVTRVTVFRRPRVVIISTGDEVVPPQVEPAPGQVRDINTYTLASLAREAGALPICLGIVPDEHSALERAARSGLAQGEVLVISAGSSVSTRDMTASVIASLGKPGILVHGLSIRPGKPTILAVVDGKPVFGLPGNPVSAMVVFDLVVRPAIFTVGGCKWPPLAQVVQARLARNVPSATGREDHVQVRLEHRDGELWAEPIFGESNLITTMIRADGMARVPLDSNGLSAGEMVTVRVF